MSTNSYPMDAARFAQLRQDLADAGATMTFTDPTQNTGSFNPPGHSEITIGFAFAAGALQLTVLHESWYENADEIWSGLATYLPEPNA